MGVRWGGCDEAAGGEWEVVAEERETGLEAAAAGGAEHRGGRGGWMISQ